MSKILIIGCGGVASVAIEKCAKKADVFPEICIASRTVSKCDALKEKLEGITEAKITTAQVDADNVEELTALIKKEQPKAVLNLALPYQDLTIMDACLYTRNGVKKRDLPHILIIPGSGLTGRDLRKRESQLFWAAALTPE